MPPPTLFADIRLKIVVQTDGRNPFRDVLSKTFQMNYDTPVKRKHSYQHNGECGRDPIAVPVEGLCRVAVGRGPVHQPPHLLAGPVPGVEDALQSRVLLQHNTNIRLNPRLEKNHRLLSIFFYFNFPLHFSRPKSF